MDSKQLCCVVLVAALVYGSQAFQLPARKTWWAKRVLSDDYYTAGWLSERQIKYASEGPIKSLLSIPPPSPGSEQGRPSTEQASATAKLAGLPYRTLQLVTDGWKTAHALQSFTTEIQAAEKPVLVYDDNAFASTFLLLLYFAQETRKNSGSSPRVGAQEVFSVGASLGFDFSEEEGLVALVEDVTGEIVSSPQKPDVSPSGWYKHYWEAKPLGGKWFVAGQFSSPDVPRIQAAGFTTLINYRKGTETSRSPSQEEVTLLNIKDRTGTYTGEGRQTTSELEKNRIDANRPNAYIDAASTVNYESRNPLEYGDDIGYNEEVEKSQIPADLAYVHLPIGGAYTYNQKMWTLYGPQHVSSEAAGPVLAHCRTGFRSSVVAIIHIAEAQSKNSTWVLDRLKEVGYDIAAKAPSAITLYQDVLDQQDPDAIGAAVERCVFNWFIIASLSALLVIL